MEKNNQVAVQQGQRTQVALSTLADAATLIEKYAANITSKEEAHEYATHVSLMAQQNPKIRDCDPRSVVVGMMACVRVGMMPNTPEQYVALIPYGKELQFQIMYRGLAQLAYNSGIVNKIDADLVFPEDQWAIEGGTDRRLIHRYTLESLDRDRTQADEALFVYSTAILRNGEKAFEVMNQSQILKIKEKAVKATGNGTPWQEWATEQYKKTVVKRFCKLLPKSSKDDRLAYAIQADNLAEAGKLNVDIETGEIMESQVVDKRVAQRVAMEAAEASYKSMKLNDTNFKPKAVKTNE